MRWMIGLAMAGVLAGQDLRGVIDIHAHCDPDSMPRSVDGIEAARLAKERGLRAIVLKNHWEPTAGLAYLARKAVPGIEVFGGIALNRTVGGVNPAAVDQMARVKGGFGRIVWMPTFDAENQVRFSREDRAFVRVSRDGQLLPEVKDVLDVVAKHNLVLATGHSSAAEALDLIREARLRGVKRIVVTHAMLEPVSMTLEQLKQAAQLGAFVEFVGNSVAGKSASVPMKNFAAGIRAAGFAGAILSSDFGQAGNPVHAEGMAMVLKALAKEGISDADLQRITRTNPARLLGLE